MVDPAPAATDAATGIALARRALVPAQRSPDAFTAYASVHELGIELQRAAQADEADEAETPARD